MQCDSEQFDGTTVATCPKCHQEICPAENQDEIIKLTNPNKKPLTLEEKLKRENERQNDYSHPWLCYIFNIAGILSVFGGIISFVFIVQAVDQKKDFIFPLAIWFFCIFAAIFDFGIAQLIAFIGETAYNTKILRIIAEHGVTGSSTQDSNAEEYTPENWQAVF